MAQPTNAAATLADGFLPLGDGPSLNQSGDWIDRYRLIELLGRGGMGEVWLAEQLLPVRRKVALKMIRARLVNDMARAYFEFERQALARMRHPAIAQIYDAGESSLGIPYLVMEYAEGRTLDLWLDEGALSQRARLELFVRIARGVQHAHLQGVVHRDIKPNNLIVQRVDGLLNPKLIDFGIAMAAEQAGPTSDRLGTRRYMSPEQAGAIELQVDHRTDIFALGVLLRDMLDPRLASVVAAPMSTTTSLAGDAFKPFSVDVRGLNWELAQLLERACAFHPDERLESAAMLADEIERYLARQPLVTAHRNWLYVARKFVQRHSVAVSAVSLTVASLAGALAVSSQALIEARTARAAAEQSAQTARAEAQRATAVSDFLREMLGSIDPSVAQGADTTLLKRVLEGALARLERDLGNQPATMVDLLAVVARTFREVGESERALEVIERGLKLSNEPGLAGERALLLLDRAYLAGSLGRVEMAQHSLEQARTVADSLGDALPVAVQMDLLKTPVDMAFWTGNYADGIVAAEQYLLALGAAGPEHDSRRRRAQHTYAVLLDRFGRIEDAERVLRELLAEFESKPELERHPDRIAALASLIITHLQRKQFDVAEPLVDQALALAESVLGENVAQTAHLTGNKASILRQTGRIEEAGHYYRLTLERIKNAHGQHSLSASTSALNYGNYLRDTGDLDGAWKQQLEAMDIAKAAVGGRSPVVGTMALQIVITAARRGSVADVEYWLRQAEDQLRGEVAADALPMQRIARFREALAAGKLEDIRD